MNVIRHPEFVRTADPVADRSARPCGDGEGHAVHAQSRQRGGSADGSVAARARARSRERHFTAPSSKRLLTSHRRSRWTASIGSNMAIGMAHAADDRRASAGPSVPLRSAHARRIRPRAGPAGSTPSSAMHLPVTFSLGGLERPGRGPRRQGLRPLTTPAPRANVTSDQGQRVRPTPHDAVTVLAGWRLNPRRQPLTGYACNDRGRRRSQS